MTSKTHKLVSLLLTTVFLLAACAPQAAPTVNADEIVNQAVEAVAATLSAQQALTAAAQPQATATEVAPSVTETPALPTATPFVIASPTTKPSSGGGGTTVYSYACDPDIGKRPRDNSTFHPGDSFDVKWTIVNTGTATWEAGYDLVYFSGPQLTGATFFELPRMKPGDKFSIVMDAVTPNLKGNYVMTWKLQGGFCYPYIAITVE